jgi:hypothetical protein
MQLFKRNFVLLILVLFISLSSCEIINPEEQIPSYLRIDSIEYNIASSNEAKISNLTDAWVYIDDQILGAFELPAEFPVLAEGKHKVTIKPGIKVSGISETRGAYPFFENYITEVNFIADSAVSIIPVATYYKETQFFINEDFESSGVLFEKTSRSDTSLVKTNDTKLVLDGEFSGVVHLNTNARMFECKSIEFLKIPTAGKPVFLEICYKSDIPFTIGFFANFFQTSEQHSVLVVNTSAVWNKIYINLADAISNYSDARDFNIFIGTTIPEGVSEATLYFDNIRLVHM